MRLRAIRSYRAGPRSYEPGQVIDVDDAEGQWLNRDSPGTFEEYRDPPKAIEAPPKDKMVRRGRTRVK